MMRQCDGLTGLGQLHRVTLARALDTTEELVGSPEVCVDHGERTNGYYDYFCAFARYELTVGPKLFRARRYADEWDKVSIFPSDHVTWTSVPYDNEAFHVVVSYFLHQQNVSTVDAFVVGLGGYVEIDPKRPSTDLVMAKWILTVHMPAIARCVRRL